MTRIRKDPRSGWRAESQIEIPTGHRLDITTRKLDRGVTSTATCVKVDSNGMFVTYMVYQDFYMVIERWVDMRCTEKNICEMHARAMERIGSITDAACDFYARKAVTA